MLQTANNPIILYYLAGTLFFTIMVAAIIFYIFIHQKRVNSFRTQLKQEEIIKQRAIYTALQDGEERERTRIAQELHDGISAKLSGFNMNLEYLKTTAESDENKILVDRTFNGISDIITELRTLSHNLQLRYFEDHDIVVLIEEYIAQLNQIGLCNFSLFIETSLNQLTNNLRLHCYRIICELLHNIHKHAQATEGFVQIANDDDRLIIIISDNGVGFDKKTSKGIGLTNVINRVNINNGSINVDSSKNGTTTIIELPLQRVSNEQ